MKRKLLLLDGDTRAALAALRSLARAGFQVEVAGPRSALCRHSRFCSRYFELPSPSSEQERFRLAVLELLEGSYSLLLPCTDAALAALYPIEQEIRQRTAFPFVSHAQFALVENKGKLLAIAREEGLAVPKTLVIQSGAELDWEEIASFSFPAVLKGISSSLQLGASIKKFAPRYVASPEELGAALDDLPGEASFLLQERIVGEGLGYFALCKGGEVLTDFSHRRILEKPPSGGVSVLSEAIPTADVPAEEARRLLKRLSWQGVAMVEFKRNSLGAPILMEINPRFWGSIQLAISSGRNFPALLAMDAIGQELPEQGAYATGMRLRWILGNIDHVISRLKADQLSFAKELLFGNALSLSVKHKTVWETLDGIDLRPFFFECNSWMRGVFR